MYSLGDKELKFTFWEVKTLLGDRKLIVILREGGWLHLKFYPGGRGLHLEAMDETKNLV